MASAFPNGSQLYVQSTTARRDQYFVITITNYPNLLQHTQHFQQLPNQQWQQHLRGGMLSPNVPIHFGIPHTEEHETILYNTLRFELEECIKAYLQRTGRSYPINYIHLLTIKRSIMEFDSKDFKLILTNLLSEHSMQIDTNDFNDICKAEPMEISNVTEQETSSTKGKKTDIADNKSQRFCLVIFNNSKWSQILNNKSSNQHQRLQATLNWSIESVVKNEKQDRSLDDQFIAQLQQLIKEYMQHTTRPLPLKYFLDLTEK
ncbi:unnamed protein product [Rotaria sordida]|uniref:Uncharacterized protein n=1 Tax=Rotaria sordida TaxID=392033 RepID=A0A815KV46_9BILA|nr:unnamed protein product [Rotaria sordida]CAF3846175.1 unnamed protein product [Rotaria sordida]